MIAFKDTMENQLKTIVNESRGLCFDMVAQANSGHLGLPLGCADCMAVLWGYFLRFLPKNPRWINRDRFILSAGHGSTLLYAYLHLSGFGVTLEDLKQFRQLHSKTPGHPEFGVTPGVEATTGPLGQGIGNAVGFAVSQKKLAAEYNTEAFQLFDNCVVCLCGEGCLQEGVGQESIALAGLWKLDNLILIYDQNKVTLDASADISQNEDVRKKFEALGWDVFEVDGHNCSEIMATLDHCRSLKEKPKVILLRTTIGLGLSVAGTSKAHGAAGLKDGNKLKLALNLDPEKSFYISEGTQRFFEKRRIQLQKQYNLWAQKFEEWTQQEPEKAYRLLNKKGSENAISYKREPVSMRECAGTILNSYAQKDPRIITGSADLFESVKNYIQKGSDFSSTTPSGRNLFFGIREHAMGAILNGIAYDGFWQASGSTFLVFSDYLKPAIRVAALSYLPVWYFFSHDSIAVGEDGPTHQPVEQLCGLRNLPNTLVFRPADADEMSACFHLAQEYNEGPSLFVLSRQTLPYLTTISSEDKYTGACQGAYILRKETEPLDVILIATGSEVALALEIAEKLGKHVRVVSMPSCEVFLQQPLAYQETVLPNTCDKRISLEAAATAYWYRFVGLKGLTLGVDSFGCSAPSKQVFEAFDLTCDACLAKIHTWLKNR